MINWRGSEIPQVGDDQAVGTREEALRGFTLNAAHAGLVEHLIGLLEPGKRADFVVLGRDLMTVPMEAIPYIEVREPGSTAGWFTSASDPGGLEQWNRQTV